jgi:orotate phosphoribosyltransferase
MPILKSQGQVDVLGLIISVDRMEKGKGETSALSELKEAFQMKTCAIVTMKEVLQYLHNRPINGKVYIDDAMKKSIEDYYAIYGAQGLEL